MSMQCMFWDCRSLTRLDLSSWDVKASNMVLMFCDCERLRTLNLRGWDVASARELSTLVMDCHQLVKLDLSGWTVHDDFNNWDDLFRGCERLKQPVLDGCDPETKRRILEQYERSR